jgi:HSP20 family molecular chaperone IbpA
MKTKIILFGILLVLLILLVPGAALGWSPYGYGPPGWPPSQGVTEPRGLRLERSADQDNYHLVLHLSGMTASEVGVTLGGGGRWLAIDSSDRSESSQNESNDEGGYYFSRSYSYSSSRFNRRISLPRDADGAAMSRKDGVGRIDITIPRRKQQ